MEIEAKFLVPDLAAVRALALEQGAMLHAARRMEHNLRFDTPDGALTRAHKLLRLRQAGAIHITYKHAHTPEKRTEIELEVDEFNATRSLLEALGFQVVFGYEKYRETFTLGSCLLMLDELPFGCYLEVEGPSLQAVQSGARALEMEWSQRVMDSYRSIFERLRACHAWTFQDAYFTNFEALTPFNPADLDPGYPNQVAPPETGGGR
jgi:adenylate cyclase class 2